MEAMVWFRILIGLTSITDIRTTKYNKMDIVIQIERHNIVCFVDYKFYCNLFSWISDHWILTYRDFFNKCCLQSVAHCVIKFWHLCFFIDLNVKWVGGSMSIMKQLFMETLILMKSSLETMTYWAVGWHPLELWLSSCWKIDLPSQVKMNEKETIFG